MELTEYIVSKKKVYVKLKEKEDALKKYIPEQFPSEEEIRALYERDRDGTLAVLIWLIYISGREVQPGEEEDYLFAKRLIRENVR